MIKNIKSYLMPTYGDRDLEFIYGKGSYLYTKKNKKYLDFGSGIAVNSLGHCNPKLISSLNKQSKKLWHTSNYYFNKHQEDYAKLLCQNSFAEKVFFTNSGTESIECGLKVIRSYHHHHSNIHKKNIISFEGAFHGRSLGALSTQFNNKYSESFKPLLPGFIQVPFDDFKYLEKKVNENTAAIMIETIQGEGGIRPTPLKFLEKIKKICIKNNLILFLDEVQCGFGRSGKLFAYEWSKIEPDVMALAKGMGSGFPIGACLATDKSAVGMTKGKHGSTFGGNPLAISVGSTVLKEILKKGFLKNVKRTSEHMWNQLIILKNNFEEIMEVRGSGLLLGIKTKSSNIEITKLFETYGLLTIPAADNTIRFAPPLIIKIKEVDRAIHIISKALKELKK